MTFRQDLIHLALHIADSIDHAVESRGAQHVPAEEKLDACATADNLRGIAVEITRAPQPPIAKYRKLACPVCGRSTVHPCPEHGL